MVVRWPEKLEGSNAKLATQSLCQGRRMTAIGLKIWLIDPVLQRVDIAAACDASQASIGLYCGLVMRHRVALVTPLFLIP